MKVGIIGAGNVGSATAFALVMRGIARKVILVDYNNSKAVAEATDIAHATTFSNASKIKAGNYEDLKNSKIVIITAGANQKPGETRTDLLNTNVKIFESIVPQIAKHAPDCIIIVASNPVDVMTRVTLELSKFPKNRVFGSGTILDTSRFRTLLGYHLSVSPQSTHANVLGEHGDSEVLVWSNAEAGTVNVSKLSENIGKPITKEIKNQIDDNVRNAAYKIIEGKGSTFYGIAGCLTRICQAINNNEYTVLTVSSIHDEAEGIKDVCISYPSVIGRRGIHSVIYPELDEEEHDLLKKSAQTVKENSDIALKAISK